jgi:hypothetical protein
VKDSGPLKRGKPLKRTQLSRTGEKPLRADPAKVWDWANRSRRSIPPRSKRRVEEMPERQEMVYELLRDYPVCAAQIPVICTKISTEVNEIVRRGQWAAGYLDRSNTETLCHNCHAFITAHPGPNGWAVRHGHQLEGFVRLLEDFDGHVRSARATRRRVLGCGVDCPLDHREADYVI